MVVPGCCLEANDCSIIKDGGLGGIQTQAINGKQIAPGVQLLLSINQRVNLFIASDYKVS